MKTWIPGVGTSRKAAIGKWLVGLGCNCLLAGIAVAQSSAITLNIDARRPGFTIPSSFVGLSVSSLSIDGGHGYRRCFTTANSQMLHLCREIGIKHLRTIMGKADPKQPDPTDEQIDAFFDFAAAAGVKQVIWSLHLYNAGDKPTNWSNNRAVAAHIWNTATRNGTRERDLLESFALDNEPDWLRYICCADPVITGYLTPPNHGYIDQWNSWCRVIGAVDVAPGARFSGPDTGSEWPVQTTGAVNTSVGGVPFTLRFARDSISKIITATQHYYGASSKGLSAEQMAEDCLSANWVTNNYPALADGALSGAPEWPINHAGSQLPYRFTECSAFNNGGGNSGNQIFATALWALDFYHWWAQRGCVGVDPFTRTAQFNSPIYFDGTNYVAEPYAYALKAFSLGGHGSVILPSQFRINNPSNINLTAYGAVNENALYVTIINKTFNSVGARTAKVSIPAPAGFIVKHARYILLSGGAAAGISGAPTIKGACLGGAELPNDGSAWAGKWTEIAISHGDITLDVLPTTAVIVELQNGHSKAMSQSQ